MKDPLAVGYLAADEIYNESGKAGRREGGKVERRESSVSEGAKPCH